MLTIGALARSTRVSPDTIRYYEREKLLAPAGKTAAGYRLFDQDAVRRLQFIRHAQQCGFSLVEIRELLTLRQDARGCCGDVRTLAIERKLQLEAKIKAMTAMSRALDTLIADCGEQDASLEACPILAVLDSSADSPEALAP